MKKYWPIFLLLFILIIVTYGNSLNNAFLSDDLAEIVNNPKINDLSYAITTHPFGFIRLIAYFLAFQMGGLNPILFRSINILFHTGCVFLIYLLFDHLYSKRLAIFVAGIFAVHPAISEAVVWISGGSYPQYAFFFLLSFLFYVFAQRKGKVLQASSTISHTASEAGPYLLSSIFYLLSLMSHSQMPLALFLVFPLYEFCFGPPAGGLKKNFVKSIPFALISITYLIISLGGLPERETTLQTMHYQQGGMDNPLVLIPIALTSYFELTLFPKILTLYHSELSFGSINFAVRAAVSLFFLVGILYSFKKSKFIFFWLSFFLLALSPTLTPFRLNWIVAERYLYLPILGLLAVLTMGLNRLCSIPKYKQIVYILFVLIIISLSIRTIIRNIDWKNEDNLWIATGKTSPSSPNTHNNLGDVYGRHGDKQAALREFQKAIELKPNYGDAYHNLANTYMELGQIDKALENYQNALKFNPNLWQSYQNIAAIYFQQKKYDLALEEIQKAIKLNPKNLNLKINLGVIYLSAGEKEKAKEIFQVVLAVDPQNQLATQGLQETNK